MGIQLDLTSPLLLVLLIAGGAGLCTLLLFLFSRCPLQTSGTFNGDTTTKGSTQNDIYPEEDHHLVLATIVKPAKDAPIYGLGLSDDFQISSLEGMFVNTDLKIGMWVLKINNILVRGMTPKSIVCVIANSVSSVTILADSDPLEEADDLIVATVIKPTQDTPVGLGLMQDPYQNITLVGSVEGLFSHTDLKAGMRILKINNIGCLGISTATAEGIIVDSVGPITVLAQQPVDLESGGGLLLKKKGKSARREEDITVSTEVLNGSSTSLFIGSSDHSSS